MVSDTPLIAAILLLIVTLLAANVSGLRMRLGVRFGDGDDKRLLRAIRAHANALEHGLPFILMLYFYELKGGPDAPIRLLGGLFIAARLSHALGMIRGPFNAQRLGATATIVLELWVLTALLAALL